jgi:hypothetical protein
VVWRDIAIERRILNLASREEWRRELERQALKDQLKPRSLAVPIAQAVGRQLMEAFLTVEEFTEFARRCSFAVRVEDADVPECGGEDGPQAPAGYLPFDFSMLATREQIIQAFGSFTGMDMSWFSNLKDAPALRKARKVQGQGGRGMPLKPYFCPCEVMQWLISPKRKKGRGLSTEKGWSLLQRHFPKVYEKHSAADPR